MARKNPYLAVTKPVQTTEVAEIPQPSYMRALLDAPVDTRGPSLAAAEKYRVDERNYTAPERKAAEHAMDFNGVSSNALTFIENTGFPGFPTLALLAQLPEYRSMHERLADECVRCWGKVVSAGDADAEKLQVIEAELERINLVAVMRQAVIHDQAFGGAHVYFKTRGDEEKRELPMLMQPYSVPKDSFEGLRVIEPYWVTPNNYNSIDPTAADFYKPSSWWMLGIECHATRLQTIMSRPVPDMLKPAYSFRGMSMSQLAQPYVDNWLRTRQSVSDAVKQYAVSGVKMDLQQALLPGGATSLQTRAQLLNAYRDNRNLLAIDMATEEFFTVATPLAGLDALQAQSQEQMAAVSHIPLVVLLGVTPTGLNASSEGEIRVFYDYVRGVQNNVLMALMMNVLKIVQLSKFGEIDPHVIWEWAPLLELTALEEADARAKDADTDERYVAMGAVTAEQITAVLHNDAHSRYAGILDTGEDLESTPDDNIPLITQHILNIGNTGGPLLEGVTGASGGANETGDPLQDGLNALQSVGTAGGEAGQLVSSPTAGALNGPATVQSDPTITDPNEQTDPGVVSPDDEQTTDHAMDDHWVTAKPNGPENVGTPLLIGKGGKIKGGAGGKLNGQKAGGKGAAGAKGTAKAKGKSSNLLKSFEKLNEAIQKVSDKAWETTLKQQKGNT